MASDHGLFNIVRRYLDEYCKKLKFEFITNVRAKYINKGKDLQYLKFLRDLIQKILDALNNLEMCIEADYSVLPMSNPLTESNDDFCPFGISRLTTDNWVTCPYRTLANNNIPCQVSSQIPNTNGGTSYCNHPDAVSNYFASRNNQGGNVGKLKGNSQNPFKKIGDRREVAVVFPTDNEVRNFLTNRLGYNKDQADQIVAQSQIPESKIDTNLSQFSNMQNNSSKTSDGRTVGQNQDLYSKKEQLVSALGDFAKTLNPQTIADLANKLSDIL
jgi:hypothetical protein